MNPLDRYIHKTVPLKFRGADLSFDLSHALFSSFDIDAGSRLLLKLVGKHVKADAVGSILDIGSGVGVLGVACARGFPGASLCMRDRDGLACAVSERNARKNKVAPLSVDWSLFLDGIEGRSFDLALCNVPAKAGPPVLERFLRELPGALSGRGYGAIVVVEPLAAAALASLRASGADIELSERTSSHTAFLFRRGSAPATLEDKEGHWKTMERTETGLQAGRQRYRFRGYWGLPEFDTPSFASELAMELCENAMAGLLVRRALFVNPGAGRVASHVKARAKGATVDVQGRDALALAATARNLALVDPAGESGFLLSFDSPPPPATYDLLVEHPDIVPRVDTFGDSWSSAMSVLKLGGSFVAAMPSTAMERFERQRPKGWVRLAERKKKGYACAAWRLESTSSKP